MTEEAPSGQTESAVPDSLSIPWELSPPSASVLRLGAALFDPEFYLRTYPDVGEARVDPFAHYVERGWREGRDPSPTFSTRGYLEANPDVAAADLCPLLEYAKTGVLAGRPLSPSLPYRDIRKQVSAAFDIAFYLESYRDVADAGVDPLEHYLEYGWRESRNPSCDFDTKYYLDTNPEVSEIGVCPLLHYVTQGKREGRSPRPQNPWHEIVTKTASLPHPGALRSREPELTESSILSEALRTSLRGAAGTLLCLSHSDYAQVFGGVENCVAHEEETFRKNGWVYLHLCPALSVPMLADPVPPNDFFVSVRLNGEHLGIFGADSLIQEMAVAGPLDTRRLFVLHHVRGFAPEVVNAIGQAFNPHETIAWVHDFFTLCPNPVMMRNNLAFCGGPDPGSSACGTCVYGAAQRQQHIERMKALFDTLKPTVLAPSETALAFWRERSPFAYAKAQVVSLGDLVMQPHRVLPLRARDEALRVGFTGSPVYHKGWHVFEELAVQFQRDPRYAFFHLGFSRPGARRSRSTFVEVNANGRARSWMIDAVIANRIDVVVNWSLCYETFCFTAHEAIAGGAFVLARNGSGNLAHAILEYGPEIGQALDTEAELFELFASGKVLEIAKRHGHGDFYIRPGTAYYLRNALDGVEWSGLV